MWNIDRLLLSKNDLSLKSQFIRSFLIAMFLIRLRVANPQIAALLIKEKKTKRNVERKKKKINALRNTIYYILLIKLNGLMLMPKSIVVYRCWQIHEKPVYRAHSHQPYRNDFVSNRYHIDFEKKNQLTSDWI